MMLEEARARWRQLKPELESESARIQNQSKHIESQLISIHNREMSRMNTDLYDVGDSESQEVDDRIHELNQQREQLRKRLWPINKELEDSYAKAYAAAENNDERARIDREFLYIFPDYGSKLKSWRYYHRSSFRPDVRAKLERDLELEFQANRERERKEKKREKLGEIFSLAVLVILGIAGVAVAIYVIYWLFGGLLW